MFKKLALSVFMVGMLSLSFMQFATAAQRKPLARTVIFYATAAKVDIVGFRDTDCDGNVYQWGVVTLHRTLEAFPCD